MTNRTIDERRAKILAFTLTSLTPKGYLECKWPEDWPPWERADFRRAARSIRKADELVLIKKRLRGVA